MNEAIAKIVWDGTSFYLPEECGTPNKNQLVSTPLDNLVELAGRVCYDSLGSEKSRDSEAYHKHIIEVGHGSVWEHANLSFRLYTEGDTRLNNIIYELCLNRPGLYIIPVGKNGIPQHFRFTMNLRTIREFEIMSKGFGDLAQETFDAIRGLAKEKAPLVLKDLGYQKPNSNIELMIPHYEEEIWVSFYIAGVSRGLSHELVRHGDWTAISQRSTRYVDESESEWIWHPLMRKVENDTPTHQRAMLFHAEDTADSCRAYYHTCCESLQEYLINKGIDKFTARKQARGAARGILGNALSTELIFSANLRQWKRMIAQRASQHADAEIRLLFNKIFEQLRSKFPESFKNYITQPCPDGLGYEVKV